MPTFAELKARTIDLVQDSGLDSLIADLLNQGIHEIAGGMQSTLGDTITPPLPDLFTIATVDTSITDAFVSMPSTFQRTLQFVISSDSVEIAIANSFIEFTEADPLLEKTGSIYEAIEFGKKLYYQSIPTVSEEVTLHFYRLPVDMDIDSDLPDGIPLHLQYALLTNFAAWKAFEFIEDGIEGETPNTEKYLSFFQVALRTLELSLPHDTRGLELR